MIFLKKYRVIFSTHDYQQNGRGFVECVRQFLLQVSTGEFQSGIILDF
jgi:hypothetical protein